MNTSMMIEVMHGFGKIGDYSRNSGCGYECGRKTFRWDNGPQGFGDGSPAGKSTQWPSSLNMGATFDPELAGEWGLAMGTEFWMKGTNIQEGPGANIARIENNGRTFEYLSGEDPVLGGTLVKPLVDGIQQHVMSITKHYIMNNQETVRKRPLFCAIFMLKTINLPRQARDKHRTKGKLRKRKRVLCRTAPG